MYIQAYHLYNLNQLMLNYLLAFDNVFDRFGENFKMVISNPDSRNFFI